MDHTLKVKLLQGNIGEKLEDVMYGIDLLDTTTKAWPIKEIIDKLDFIKIRNFCSVKENVKKMRGKVTG